MRIRIPKSTESVTPFQIQSQLVEFRIHKTTS